MLSTSPIAASLPCNILRKWPIFQSQLTHILCLSLFLGLPIGFAYRRLIWSAFLCSSFFPFSFGLQTWQIHVPGKSPDTYSRVCFRWVYQFRGHTVYLFLTFPLHSDSWRGSHLCTMTIDYSARESKWKSIRKTLDQFAVFRNRLRVSLLNKAMRLVWIACQMSY